MKRNKIIALIAATLFCTAAFCQQLATEKVPEEVQSSFKAKFPAGSNVLWGKEANGNYEAKFLMGSEKQRAEFDGNGKWVETENTISANQVPKIVHDAIMKQYPTCKITEAEEVQTSDQGKVYEVGCTVGKEKRDIRVSANGKVEKKIEKKY